MTARCYLCPVEVDPTRHRDHIPPKTFFPQPRPSNLVTVPCCERCNSGASIDDDAFKAWFSIAIGASPAAAAANRGATLPSAFRRSEKFTEHTISLIEHGVIDYLDGAKEMDGIVIPKARFARFLTRIVKGLLRHYEPRYDYASDSFTVKHLAISQQNLDLLAPFQMKSRFDSRGAGVASYRWIVDADKHVGLWLITFFESTNALVHHTREKE